MKVWVALFALALVTVWLGVRSARLAGELEALRAAEPASEATSAPVNDGLEARVRALEMEIDRLRAEPPSRAVAPAAAPSSEPLAAAPEDTGVHAVIEALESEDPQVRERLRDVLRTEREALREAERDERRQARLERLKERVTQLGETASLQRYQVEFLYERLSTEHTALREVFRDARRSGSFGEVRRNAEAIRSATDAEVEAELDDDAFAAYLAMREEDLPPWWRRRAPETTPPPATAP